MFSRPMINLGGTMQVVDMTTGQVTEVDCYVLDDPMKTSVISQRGMGQAIGFSRRGSRLAVFVNSQTMDGYIGRDLKEKIENPIVFQTSRAAAESSVSAVARRMARPGADRAGET